MSSIGSSICPSHSTWDQRPPAQHNIRGPSQRPPEVMTSCREGDLLSHVEWDGQILLYILITCKIYVDKDLQQLASCAHVLSCDQQINGTLGNIMLRPTLSVNLVMYHVSMAFM